MTSKSDTQTVTTKKPGQAVVEALKAEGVDLFFGMVGSHVLSIYDALVDAPEIRQVTVKHENNASLMADMYGRLTGRPGVVIVTAGPGATNSLSGLVQAFDYGSPVVHITGTVPTTSQNETFHGTNRPDFLYKMFQDVTKWSTRITQAEEIPGTLSRAFAVALSGRPGPVHVEIPQDILESGALPLQTYKTTPRTPLEPNGAVIDEIARVLKGARSTVLVAGRGILYYRGCRELRELADRLGSPVIMGRDALGVLPDDHPMHAGYFGKWIRNPLASELVVKADVVLSVGLRPGTETGEMLRHMKPRNLYFVGVDEGDTPPPDVRAYTAANSRIALERILSKLTEVTRQPEPTVTASVKQSRLAQREALDRYLEQFATHVPMHFGLAAREIARQLPPEGIVVGDIGNSESWTRYFIPVRNETTQVRPGSWGAMGFALPGAIAAKIVHPDRPVLAVVGDGALMMSFSDFGTAVETGANILVVVLNDSRFGMIHRLQMMEHGRGYASEIRSPDFVKFAQSFGAAGLRVQDPTELPQAVARALAMTKESPVILDVVCGYDWPMP